MSRLLSENDWSPVGVTELEPTAEDVVRSTSNMLVVAGPGAGKTELLAQRANFLLETGRCPAPKRILAISFKRDAAKNLGARVRERCRERADRFDSLTLDAFAKRLVDRFLLALPAEWRPRDDYQVRTSAVDAHDAEMWLSAAAVPAGSARPAVQTWDQVKIRRVFDLVMHGAELPLDSPITPALQREWSRQWWKEQLRLPGGQPSLTFPMLNRLAAYLLRCNPKILAALRLTYSHVFLDEFQDTTASQWDLVRSAFLGSTSVLTAVGDGKQRIMVWAGAKTDVFERFQDQEEFAAERVDLVRNYRSVPELVRMQHIIAQAVEAGSVEPVSASANRETGACSIVEFRNSEEEAAYLADLINREIIEEQSNPRDYCILVRQQSGIMVTLLQAELYRLGVLLRDESELQDLRAEPVTGIVLLVLRLATRKRDAQAWGNLVDELVSLSGLDKERDGVELERIASKHKNCIMDHLVNGNSIHDVPRRIVEILGQDRYRSTYRQYVNGDYLEKVINNLGEALQASLDIVGDAKNVVDDMVGINVAPAMTIHKSKGLEFKTVIFLGLEDGQWWNFRKQPEEETRAFFVAFSRAIHRVMFTFCDERDTKWGRRRQKREEVNALHTILLKAGVQVIDQRGFVGGLGIDDQVDGVDST